MSSKQHGADTTAVDDRGLVRGEVLSSAVAAAILEKPASEMRVELLEWFRARGRHYPWRDESNPWKVLITEILLRKTTADAVARFLPRFLDRYPNPHALSGKARDELASQMAVLGLRYQRADQLLALAKALIERYGGRIPEDLDALLALPAVGLYTAIATRVFGFGKAGGVVDTNTVRIIARVYEIKSRKVEARKDRYFWDIASHVVGDSTPAEINWSLLDLGALICTPRNPVCKECPIRTFCGTGQRMLAD